MEVLCTGCQASYQLEERRVPFGKEGKGMTMRCPACGTSFLVRRPDDDMGNLPALPARAGATAASPEASLPAVKKPPALRIPAPEAPQAGPPPLPPRGRALETADLPAARTTQPADRRSMDRLDDFLPLISPQSQRQPITPPPASIPLPALRASDTLPSFPSQAPAGRRSVLHPAVVKEDLPNLRVGLPSSNLPTPSSDLPRLRESMVNANAFMEDSDNPFGVLDLPLVSPARGGTLPGGMADEEAALSLDLPLILGNGEAESSNATVEFSYRRRSSAPPTRAAMPFVPLDLLPEEESSVALPVVAPKGDAGMISAKTVQKTQPSASATVDVAAVRTPAPQRLKKRLARRILPWASVAGILLLAGASVSATSYGPFGWYLIHDLRHRNAYQALLATSRQQTQVAFQPDLAISAQQAVLAIADTQPRMAPRAYSLAAYGAFAAYLYELRFGHDDALNARARALLRPGPANSQELPYLLARSAQAAAEPQGLARALTLLEPLVQRYATDPDVNVLAGELFLLARDDLAAQKAWETLLTHEDSPRARFGLARTHLAAGRMAEARQSAQRVLIQQPDHIGAQILLARLAWTLDGDGRPALALRQQSSVASPRAEISTLVGHVWLAAGIVSRAETAFEEALQQNPRDGEALRGSGETFFRAGRYSEALARFQTASDVDPESVDSKLGVAKANLFLEKPMVAKDLLQALSKIFAENQSTPISTRTTVLTWLGRAEEATGDKGAAEIVYRKAIAVGSSRPEAIDSYLALAQLLLGLGREADAKRLLAEAKGQLPASAALHRAFGDVASRMGRYDDAVRDYERSVALDRGDLSTLFKLGEAERRSGKLKAAAETLQAVAAREPNYPGIALERAALSEALGESAQALELYQTALAKAPNDLDLMMRVALSLLTSEQAGPAATAEELLRKVLTHRPTSAETNHALGRALLYRGVNVAEALNAFRRAADFDPNRAEYALYVGRAANELDNQPLAATAIGRALELDQSLGDAYWQRGILARRQRAIVDAEKDLLKALELRPNRYQAYAVLAEVYEDEQKWPQAEAAWQRAIAADGNQANWRFRLGKLRSQNGKRAGALDHLHRAVELATAASVPPSWLAEACLLLADAERTAGHKASAAEHYQRFLALAPSDSPYRSEATKALQGLGGGTAHSKKKD